MQTQTNELVTVPVYVRSKDGVFYCTSEDGVVVGRFRQLGAFARAVVINRFGFIPDFRPL